jgi:hypothetical protein
MKKLLIFLIFALVVLSWNFIFTDNKVVLTIPAQVLQGLSQAIAYKTAVEKYWGQTAALPVYEDWIEVSQQINVDLSQSIVKSIEVGKDGPGVITVLYTVRPGQGSAAEIDGRKINLVPVARNGKLDWTCVGTFGVDLLPRNCSPMTANH